MNDWGQRDPHWSGIRTEEVTVRLARGEHHPARVLRLGSAGGGLPQLLIHGLGGSSRNWLDAMPPLASHGEVVAADLPGFGRTRVPDGGSARVRANAGFVVALLDALGWDEAVLVGNSMGGLIVTLVAARQPQRVARLVLANPALPSPRRDMFRQSARVWSRIIPVAVPGVGRLLVEADFRRKTAEQIIAESLASNLGDAERVRPALRAALVENVAEGKAEAWRRAAIVEAGASLVGMHLAEAKELYDAVAGIAAPTLLLWGDLDRLIATHVIDGLVERRPEWIRHVFGGVGHAPQVEAPEEFAAVVASWYETLDEREAAASV